MGRRISVPSLQRGKSQRGHRHANQKAQAIGEREDHWVFVQLSARGQQPDAADPEQDERNDQPERAGVTIKGGHVAAADVDGKDDNGCIAAGGAKGAQLLGVTDEIAAAVLERGAAQAQVFEFGKTLDHSEREKQKD